MGVKSARRRVDTQTTNSKEGTDGPIRSGNRSCGIARWHSCKSPADLDAGLLVASVRPVHADEADHTRARAGAIPDPTDRHDAGFPDRAPVQCQPDSVLRDAGERPRNRAPGRRYEQRKPAAD